MTTTTAGLLCSFTDLRGLDGAGASRIGTRRNRGWDQRSVNPLLLSDFSPVFCVFSAVFFRASDAKTAERPETNSEKTTANGRETAAGHASVGALLPCAGTLLLYILVVSIGMQMNIL